MKLHLVFMYDEYKIIPGPCKSMTFLKRTTEGRKEKECGRVLFLKS